MLRYTCAVFLLHGSVAMYVTQVLCVMSHSVSTLQLTGLFYSSRRRMICHADLHLTYSAVVVFCCNTAHHGVFPRAGILERTTYVIFSQRCALVSYSGVSYHIIPPVYYLCVQVSNLTWCFIIRSSPLQMYPGTDEDISPFVQTRAQRRTKLCCDRSSTRLL